MMRFAKWTSLARKGPVAALIPRKQQPALDWPRPRLRFAGCYLGAVAITIAFGQQRATPLPDARQLLERHLRETGGGEALKSAPTQVTRGKFTFLEADISGKATIYSDAAGRSYHLLESKEIGKIEAGNDGDIEWERTTVAGPKVIRVSSSPGSLLRPPATDSSYWIEDASQARTVGDDLVNGKPCWKVEVKMGKFGQPTRLCLDQETGLLSRVETASSRDGALFAVALTLMDYRQVGRLKLPHRYETAFGEQTMRIVVDEIRLDEKVAPDVFEAPVEVHALARRQRMGVEIKEAGEDPDRPKLKRKRK
jgi:hypothetical protein